MLFDPAIGILAGMKHQRRFVDGRMLELLRKLTNHRLRDRRPRLCLLIGLKPLQRDIERRVDVHDD